jgi:alcohol dehydrogenase class IV
MTRFDFATANRIVFGTGSIDEIARLPRAFGRRPLVVRGSSADRTARLVEALGADGAAVTSFVVRSEPDIATVTEGADLARHTAADFVVGVGGGSVMDAAKAIAALATNTRDVFDYLEVIGRGEPLSSAALPCVAVPTTAGTGSEVTRNAVLASPAHRVKVSLRSAYMLPRIAIVDPALTVSVPPALTAATGLDALTQLIEAFVSRRANPMTDAICREGIARAAHALPRAVRDGSDLDARSDMSLASLWSGIALANAGLGAVHGFAGPIGGMFDAPHGAVCAALLPHVFAANVAAIKSRAPDHPSAGKLDEVARLLTGRSAASSDDGAAWLENLVRDLGVPPLAAYGIADAHVDELVGKAMQASSMKANPIDLSAPELAAVLRGAV